MTVSAVKMAGNNKKKKNIYIYPDTDCMNRAHHYLQIQILYASVTTIPNIITSLSCIWDPTKYTLWGLPCTRVMLVQQTGPDALVFLLFLCV